MPIENERDISQEIRLRRWRVMEIETPDGVCSRHVCGHDAKNSRGRASSPIIEFNQDSMTVTTRSGNIYKLIGLPGNSRLGRSAWHRWCRDNDNVIASQADVTNEYMDIDNLSTAEFKKFNSAAGQ